MSMSPYRQAAALAVSLLLQCPLALAQSNDNWSGATVIGSLPFADLGVATNAATVEATDPVSICFVGAYGSTGRGTVWYRYTTGPQVEYLNLSTQGSDYDTVVNVYTGSPGNFTQVMGGCNDDGVGITQSLIAGLRLQPATTYSFEVLSHGTTTFGGTLNFAVGAAPVYAVTVQNDAALTLAGCPGAVCSLRAAIRKANLEPGAILLPAGVYTMTLTGSGEDGAATGDLDIHASMGIYGSGVGQTIIDPAATLAPGVFPNERTFDIDPNGSGANAATGRITANFADLEIRNSGGSSFFGDGGAIRASGNNLANNDFVTLDHVKIGNSRSALNGGAVADSGRMMIADSEFSGNSAGSTGGALTLGPAFAGGDSTVEIARSLVAGNTSTGGFSGGGGIKSTAGLRVLDSTITANSTPYHGGGIYLTGTATVEIRSSTIAGNRAASGGSASANGGGLRVDGGNVSVLNSILGDNQRGTPASSTADDCTAGGGTLVGGYDVIEAGSCVFSGNNLTGVDAGLDVLADNGGPTRTLSLLDASPALDAADPAGCTDYRGNALATDQRGPGYARVSHGRCDIGAFERQVAASATTPGTPDMRAADDTGASSSDDITRVAAPGFVGTCTDGDTVVLVVDGVATASTQACASGGYVLVPASSLTDGPHAIAARATQGASTSADSASIGVVIDTIAPGVTIASAPSGNVVDSQATIQFSTDAGATTTCSLDGAAASACSSPATFTGLAPGAHSVLVRASDVAGNSASASASWTVVLPDAPDAPLLDAASDTGSSSSDGITRADPLVLLGSCADGDSVRLEDNGSPLGSPAVCAGGYAIPLAGVAEGVHALRARATRNGLTSAPSAALDVTIDRSIDAPVVTAGPSGDVVDSAATFAFVLDADATATCALDGGAAAPCADTVSFQGLAPGPHQLAIVARDIAGNSGNVSRDWRVVLPATLAAPQLAAASDSGVSNQDRITNAATLVLAGTCVDGDSVQLDDAGVPVGTAILCGNGGYEVSLDGVAEGTHAYAARATRNGLTSAEGGAVDVVVDRHVAAPGLGGEGGPVGPDTAVGGTTEPNASVAVHEGTLLLCTATADASGSWTCTLHFSAGGVHEIDATAADVAGNVSVPSSPLAIDVDLIFGDGFEG
ncbi:Ig-like domain-containing protein [Dokdonella sp.]|uniref:Ig-like domain-containing protein n=1 Tax=Dokdonella sp. TaxID=2291710 RepID=UPI002F41149B